MSGDTPTSWVSGDYLDYMQAQSSLGARYSEVQIIKQLLLEEASNQWVRGADPLATYVRDTLVPKLKVRLDAHVKDMDSLTKPDPEVHCLDIRPRDQHVHFIRSGHWVRMYINGVLVASGDKIEEELVADKILGEPGCTGMVVAMDVYDAVCQQYVQDYNHET